MSWDTAQWGPVPAVRNSPAWLRGKALMVLCQGRKAELKAVPLLGVSLHKKIMHLDKDWKGVWKNQIYGLS